MTWFALISPDGTVHEDSFMAYESAVDMRARHYTSEHTIRRMPGDHMYVLKQVPDDPTRQSETVTDLSNVLLSPRRAS